ncbi:MAG: DUF1015 family protein [Bacteroidota bacterium]|jgi:uncharacterized protein (DUF1015 family)|nr:MAG: DUF1015 domain-containing protein [Bacteroidota bacterium]
MNIRPFKGFRPIPELAKAVASRPYDVLDSDEAREEAKGNPHSFLNVVKPEITLPPDTDPYSPAVYEAARANFQKLVSSGVFRQDEKECLYLYELTMDGRTQDGIVACAAVDDYMEGRIKKHELTRPDKENDRKNHVRVAMMNAEPVFFAYHALEAVDALVANVKKDKPEYDFVADDGIQHRLWVISDQHVIDQIVAAFATLPATYVADGHHRTAAAALVGHDLRMENPNHTGNEEYNYFLAVHFPDNQLHIMDYNRVVRDLNGHTASSFLKALEKSFEVGEPTTNAVRPSRLHEFSMYLEGKWYLLSAKPGTYDDSDPIGVLDVTILSEQILKPLLNIQDLRTDKRIDFVGGIRGLGELQRRVDSGEMKVAFALYPVTMKQLMDIADSGNIMPPKTTWFEPKLRSGLVVHSLEG